ERQSRNRIARNVGKARRETGRELKRIERIHSLQQIGDKILRLVVVGVETEEELLVEINSFVSEFIAKNGLHSVILIPAGKNGCCAERILRGCEKGEIDRAGRGLKEKFRIIRHLKCLVDCRAE